MPSVRSAKPSLVLALLLSFLLGACVTPQGGKKRPGSGRTPSSKTKSKAKPGAKPAARPAAAPAVDAKAQQEQYDLGLRYYTQEKFAEAKAAWQQVLKLGPNTALAAQARENIKKADQILKTLNEMEKR